MMQNTKSLFFTWDDDGTTCRLCRIGLYSIGPPWKSYIPVKRHVGSGRLTPQPWRKNPGAAVRNSAPRNKNWCRTVRPPPTSNLLLQLQLCVRSWIYIFILKRDKIKKKLSSAEDLSRWATRASGSEFDSHHLLWVCVRSHSSAKLSTPDSSDKREAIWGSSFR